MKALDFWLKVTGLYSSQLFLYVVIKGEIKLPYDGVLMLWFIACIFSIILFNKILKRSDNNAR